MKPPQVFRTTVPIFKSPELVDIIFGHAGIGDCARLASTSRLVFSAAAPVIWRSLDSVIPLLKLLQAEITEVTGIDLPTTIVNLPNSAEVNFTRFDIYAPFVKTLKIDCQIGDDAWDTMWGDPEDPSPWYTFLCQGAYKPLLPNLRSLQLMSATRKTLIQTMWISVLASPSLRSIEANYSVEDPEPEALQISVPASSMILDTVVAQCPLLQRLSLFPDVVTVLDASTEDEPERTMSYPSSKPLNEYLPTLQNLQSLSSNIAVLQPDVLLMLSQLPNLESLDIHPEYHPHTPSGIAYQSLPRDAFPMLHTLKVRLLRQEDLLNLWDMRVMIAKLTCLELHFDLYSSQPPNPLTSVDWISKILIPVVCGRSRLITDLTIDFDTSSTDDGDLLTVNKEFFELIARLPLQALHLRNLAVQDQDFDSFLGHLNTLLPNMVKLRMPDQYVKFDDLRHFASLPKLEYLAVNIGYPPGWTPPAPIVNTSLSSTICPLRTFAHEHFIQGWRDSEIPDLELAEPALRYLLSFWPNLQEISQIHDVYWQYVRLYYSTMSTHLSRLRKVENA